MKVFEHYKCTDDLWYMVLSYVDHVNHPKFQDSPYRPADAPRPPKIHELTLEEFNELAKEAFEWNNSKTAETTEEEYLAEIDKNGSMKNFVFQV